MGRSWPRENYTSLLNNRVYQINTLQDLRLYLKYTTVQFEIQDENQAIFRRQHTIFLTEQVLAFRASADCLKNYKQNHFCEMNMYKT